MIEAKNLTKKFGSFTALDNLSCNIPEGCVYGMVGSNGAGKSTFLRLLAGVYKPDGGSVTLDGEATYENSGVKARMAYVPDDLYFPGGANIRRMVDIYRRTRKGFDTERMKELTALLSLPERQNISTFSKGMKRQTATILALSCKPDVLFFDETFDGLDPVMRNTVKKLICSDAAERKCTTIITSHSLRELEDTCDQLALLHKGGLVLESDVANLKTSLFKVQIGFTRDFTKEEIENLGIEVRSFVRKGSVATLIAKGDREEAASKLNSLDPAILDILPLSLEEVFVHEMDALGYSFDELLEKESEKNEK